MTVLIETHTSWYCPACGKTDRTKEARPHSRFHVCPKLRYLTTPMVRAGVAAKVELREREDYVNGERVQLDPELGRPIMSMTTTRDTGTDVRVFAPTATASADAPDTRGRLATNAGHATASGAANSR